MLSYKFLSVVFATGFLCNVISEFTHLLHKFTNNYEQTVIIRTKEITFVYKV